MYMYKNDKIIFIQEDIFLGFILDFVRIILLTSH